MSKKIFLYITSFVLLVLCFIFFNKAYDKIQGYTNTIAEKSTIYNTFEMLSKDINNTAVANPILNNVTATEQGTKLFLSDSIGIIDGLNTLKLLVKDSININIQKKLDPLVRSELPWIINSNVPDSIEVHKAAPHIQALKMINALIDTGVKRTGYLLDYNKTLLRKAIASEKKSMWISVFLTALLIVLMVMNVLNLQHKTRTREKQLALANRLLKSAQQIAQIGNWGLKADTKNIYWSDEVYNIWNLPINSALCNLKNFTDSVHPADKNFVNVALAEALAGENQLDIEHRIVLQNGAIKWVHQKGRLVADKKDSINNFEATIQDITERKNTQTKLEAATAHQYLFGSIVNSSDDAIISKTLTGIITSWNIGAEKMFGYNEEEAVGKHISIIIPADLINEELNINNMIKKGEHVKYYETERQKKDGSRLSISLIVSPILDASGCIVGASKIARDITERKRTEHKVLVANQEKAIILESIDDAFFAVDTDWVVAYWNSRAEIMLQKSKDEMLGHNLWSVFAGSIDSISYKKYHEAVETKTAIHFEDYYPPQDKWYEISAYPSAQGLSVYFKDVTHRRHTEMQLIELNENLKNQAKELARSNEELEQFAYVASHDLQEPLRMITSFLTQLEKKYDDLLDEKGKKYIGFAVDGAKRMRQIILDLLEFSRVGKTEDKKEDIDTGKLIKDILIFFRKKIEDEKAVIHTNDLPVIHTYKVPLYQVLYNLIGNALKYISAGSTPEIYINVTELERHWQFAVTDNGIGIEEEYFDKIFIIFQRLHNRDDYPGTGLGLAITKKIVENLGGKIWLISSEGKGSTFYFTIEKK